MNEKVLKQSEVVEGFLKRNNKYLENRYGLVDFLTYLRYFANIYGVYTTPYRIPYHFNEKIIKRYYKKFVCTKTVDINGVSMLTTLVQLDPKNHFIFEYQMMFENNERMEGLTPIIIVKAFSGNQAKTASNFIKKNKKNIVKFENCGSMGLGFNR